MSALVLVSVLYTATGACERRLATVPTADLPPELPPETHRYTVPEQAAVNELGARQLGERFALAPTWALDLHPQPPAIRTRLDWLVAELEGT